MPTQFDYSADRLSQKQYRGREVPVRVDDVQEKAIGDPDRPTPSLTIKFTPPDGSLELQAYEGAPDSIPSVSDLGKLIKYCKTMDIPDLGENEFAPLVGKFFWLTVQYLKTEQGVVYKRFPTRRMTPAEVTQHFKVRDPIENVRKHRDVIADKLENTEKDTILITVMGIPEVRPFSGEVSDALDKGEFMNWLKDECDLVPNEDGILISTTPVEENVNGTGSSTGSAADASTGPASTAV
jgi:hypothetical protein